MERVPVGELVFTYGLGVASYYLWRRAFEREAHEASKWTPRVRWASLVIGAVSGALVAWLTWRLLHADAVDQSVTIDKLFAVGLIGVSVMLYLTLIVRDVYAAWVLLRGPTRGGALLAIIGGPIIALVVFFVGQSLLTAIDSAV